MGGGNANKTMMSRAKHLAAAAAEGQGGGGSAGKEKRGGDTGAKIAAGQAAKAEKEAAKIALAEKKAKDAEKLAKKQAKELKEAQKKAEEEKQKKVCRRCARESHTGGRPRRPLPPRPRARPQELDAAIAAQKAGGGKKEEKKQKPPAKTDEAPAEKKEEQKETPAEPVDVSDPAPADAAKPAAPAPKKEDEETADTHLSIEGMGSQEDADAVHKAIMAVDGVKSCVVELEGKVAKVVGAPGYPTGAQLAEAVTAALPNITAKEKQLSGGKHKFDPSEVDVHGGNATADDFMDAFGF